MADDNPLEKDRDGDSEQSMEDIYEGEFLGEALIFPDSSTHTLKSDFCSAEETEGEFFAEEAWICEEVERKGEYFGEEYPYMKGYGGEGEEEEEISLEERRSLDSEYLKSVLGTPLTFALMEIASKRPTDPIQFLGHYLFKWRWCKEKNDNYDKEMEALCAEREAFRTRNKELERQAMLEKEQKNEEIRRAEKVESSLDEDHPGEGGFLLDE